MFASQNEERVCWVPELQIKETNKLQSNFISNNLILIRRSTYQALIRMARQCLVLSRNQSIWRSRDRLGFHFHEHGLNLSRQEKCQRVEMRRESVGRCGLMASLILWGVTATIQKYIVVSQCTVGKKVNLLIILGFFSLQDMFRYCLIYLNLFGDVWICLDLF